MQEKVSNFSSGSLFEVDEKTDFICPIEQRQGKNHPYVQLDYCESFCFGKGCRYMKTCPAYKLRKQKQGEKA